MPVLVSKAVPLSGQLFPDSYTYADAAWELAHGHGYVTYVKQGCGDPMACRPDPGERPRYGSRPVPPRYPFGTSAVLAPFTLLFGRPQGAQIGARVIVVLYVVAILASAWLLGGPFAALLAAAFVRASPFAETLATYVMSDPLAALLTILILIALIRRSKLWLVIAGLALGALIDVRLLGVVALPAVLLAARRGRWIVLGCATPLIALLGVYQWRTFGSPFTTGYSYWLPGIHQFGFGFATQHPFGLDVLIPVHHGGALLGKACGCNPMDGLSNLTFYPSVLSGLLWIYAPPLTGLIGLAALIRWRHTPPAQYALVVILLNLATVLVYFWQAARFVAPAASLLLIYSAVGLASFVTWAIKRVGEGRLVVDRSSRHTAKIALSGHAEA